MLNVVCITVLYVVQGDIDQISCLVKEVIPSSPCLVFCSTRKNCENVALMLIRCLPRYKHVHCMYMCTHVHDIHY